MHLYIVSGILLIVPIVDIALAAPVLVQEKRQTCADMADIIACPRTVSWKWGRGIGELGDKYIEDYFTKPGESSAAHGSSSLAPSEPKYGWTDLNQPLASIPEDHPEGHPEGYPEEWSPASSPDRTLPSPGSVTESGHDLAGMHAPLSSPVFPTWFHPVHADHRLMWAHPSRLNLGLDSVDGLGFDDPKLVVEEPPSGPASPTGPDADHEGQVAHPAPPWPHSASLSDSDHEIVDVSPSISVSSTNPYRRLMGADSRLENLPVVSGALKDYVKE